MWREQTDRPGTFNKLNGVIIGKDLMLQALSRKNSWENSCLLFCSLLIMLIIDLKSVPAQGQAESQSKKTKGADKLGKDKKKEENPPHFETN